MSKRILAMLLCAVMLVSCFAGCTAKQEEEEVDPGAYITMYLTDDIYDFDPANAYYNTDTLNVVSLMYDTLFTLDANGKVKKSLVEDYEFGVDKRTGETYMELTLNETKWSNGIRLSADDVAFAWRRLLTATNNYAAASLLYDIKNARAVKEGDVSIDNVGIEAISINRLKITFEGPVDEDQFILNLTSVATAPLLESYVSKNEDWAKKPSTMVTSGPFKLGKIFYKDILNANDVPSTEKDPWAFGKGNVLAEEPTDSRIQDISYFYLERNIYYYRDTERDDLDMYVTPYRILVDCTMTDEDIYNAYAAGKLFYLGSVPMSLRGNAYIEANKKVSNTLSTFVLYLNQYAFVDDGGDGSPLFADATVRQALSKAIDRDAIAKAVVYAQAAVGLVAPGVLDDGKIVKKDTTDFRSAGSAILATSANIAAAKADLEAADIDPSSYSFTIKVASYDDVNVKITEMVAAAWTELGFNVSVKKLTPIVNNDYLKEIDAPPEDVCDDRIVEALQRNDYEVIAMDYTAYTAGAESVLTNFATAFSGMALNMDTNQLNLHTTGYSNVEYNNLIEAIYYIPYFADLANTSSEYLAKANTKMPYYDTAIAFANSAIAQASSVAASIRAKTQVGDLRTKKAADVNVLKDKLDTTLAPMQLANRELQRAYETLGLTLEAQAELDYALQEAFAAKALAISALDAAGKAARDVASRGDAASQELKDKEKAAIAAMEAKFAEFIAIAESTQAMYESIAAELSETAKTTNSKTLYQIITEIYAANGITPTTDASEWAAQKATLLHRAEELLMKDLPVIPVIFTQNAVLSSNQLLNVNYKFTSYYTPYYFTKLNLLNYDSYVYYNELEKANVSIFSDFPRVSWDKIGK